MFGEFLKSNGVNINEQVNKLQLLQFSIRAAITFWLHLGWITCYKVVKLYWFTARDFGSSQMTLPSKLNRWLKQTLITLAYSDRVSD